MGMLQMTWQPGLVKLKRNLNSPPLGLRNIGNSCYLNSILQCLTYTPPLANLCIRYLHSSICDLGERKEKKVECPFCILEKRIARSLCSEAVEDTPVKLNSSLRLYAEHFLPGRQEDAHEFLRYVIDACHNTCLRLNKLQQPHQRVKNGVSNGGDFDGTGKTVIKEIFGGELQSQVKCLSCGAESNKVDEIMDISLDILHSGSLREALQIFFQPEVLDGNNKYKCDNCKELVSARKQMSILEAPNVLVIQLKRFEGVYGGKVDKPICFDEILVLSSYMCKASQDFHPEYNLFGAVVHSGFSPDSGHYYAYVKDAFGCWYCCNDSYVSASNLQEVLSEKVYILFFSRTKQRLRARVDMVSNGYKSHESNGDKTSVMQNLGCPPKPICSTQISKSQLERNYSTNSQESNGTKTPITESHCSEEPFNMKTSASHSKINNSTIYLASNDTKTVIDNKSDHEETPLSIKELSGNHSETNTLTPSLVSSSSNSALLQKLGAVVEPVNMKGTCDQHNQTSSSVKNVIDQESCGQQNKVSFRWSTSKPIANGNIKIAVYKREFREENGCTESTIAPQGKNKVGLPLTERNGMNTKSADVQISKSGPSCLGIINGQNGHSAVDSSEIMSSKVNGIKTKIAPEKGSKGQNLQNGEIMDFSKNSGMKRKITDDHSCILLARDTKSLAEVEAFKDAIGKEASVILQSCGWSAEVLNFMLKSKKMCLEAGNNALDDSEKKNMLISRAKREFISRVPKSLKTSLITYIRTFSQEKQSS